MTDTQWRYLWCYLLAFLGTILFTAGFGVLYGAEATCAVLGGTMVIASVVIGIRK